ncbi:MAG: hypothetical protein ABJN65_12850 [Parasphingorhabdus sp.]
MSETKDITFFSDSDSRQKGRQAIALQPTDSAIEEITVSDGNLTKIASLLLEIRTDRVGQFGNGDPQIDDVSFHILLDLMVSESSRTSISAQDLAKTHQVGWSTMLRYIDYLISIGMVKKDKSAKNLDQSVLKLTKSGSDLCNTALVKVDQRLGSF